MKDIKIRKIQYYMSQQNCTINIVIEYCSTTIKQSLNRMYNTLYIYSTIYSDINNIACHISA